LTVVVVIIVGSVIITASKKIAMTIEDVFPLIFLRIHILVQSCLLI
jgi:hypothetical protein